MTGVRFTYLEIVRSSRPAAVKWRRGRWHGERTFIDATFLPCSLVAALQQLRRDRPSLLEQARASDRDPRVERSPLCFACGLPRLSGVVVTLYIGGGSGSGRGKQQERGTERQGAPALPRKSS